MLSAETNAMLEAGGINDQPDWFMDHFSWFAPIYKQAKLMSLIERIMGRFPGVGKAIGAKGGNNARTATGKR